MNFEFTRLSDGERRVVSKLLRRATGFRRIAEKADEDRDLRDASRAIRDMPVPALVSVFARHTRIDGHALAARYFEGKHLEAMAWLLKAIVYEFGDLNSAVKELV